ncbi:hypothetical protein RhiirA4_475846 [Rhizophagus irregularis]|uniref:Uncharacterized protein n=1 Tax=Rhizophagus irregularis TaxID=588596 RepID=A0A2I1HAP2_9GLOM|nr:hypothetical protein RhiirA4_475846 [Rhizophagus irregularis]
MPHFFVSVDEGKKNIINQKIVKSDSNTGTFKELYDVITKDLYEVFMFIFVIQPEEDNGESSSRNQEIQQNQTNIFDTMMKRARHMQKREDIYFRNII